MVIKPVRRLTLALFNEYSGRKRDNLIAAVVDVSTNEVYLVPKDIEHIDFVGALLGTGREGLRADPTRAERIVPVTYELADINEPVPSIIGVLTGVSGLEIGAGVRHTEADLQKAHALGIAFADAGELKFKPDASKTVIIKCFAKKV